MAAMPRAVEALEKDFASWLGVSGAVATGYGRAAACLALEVLGAAWDGESFNGEVLVPNFICGQIPAAVRAAGARPRFYSVRPDLVIRPQDLGAVANSRSKVVLIPHYFGRLQPLLGELLAVCEKLDMTPVEDCALALGAAGADGRLAGRFTDLAIFSLTKDAWCYGGGLLATRDITFLERANALSAVQLLPAPGRALSYGLLRRADFAANRPTRARMADFAGRWLERLCGMRGANFYDAARYDSLMPAFAARRARHLLRNLAATTARRRQMLAAFYEALRDTPLLYRPQFDPGDAGSFLLLQSPDGHAAAWREQAAANGVTLRLVWPAYQESEPAQASADLVWLADHLLFLEIHPGLTTGEIAHIARTLKKLAGCM